MTSITTISDLVADVLMQAPTSNENNVLRELRLAVRELIGQSECLREDIAITTVADQADYALTPRTLDVLVHRIDSLKYDNSTQSLDERTYFLDLSTRKLNFEELHIPSESGLALTATVILIPEFQAETHPAWVLNRYALGIADRAVARINHQKGQPYIEPPAFIDAVGEARMDIERRGTQRRMETWA